MRKALVSCLGLAMAGCAVGYRNPDLAGAQDLRMPLPPCTAPAASNCLNDSQSLEPEAIYAAEVGSRINSPRVGLALSGGGSKAAPFALGVLQELVNADGLGSIDYISSVSGGSYAALYLYANALRVSEKPELGPLKRYFADIRPVSFPPKEKTVGTEGYVPAASPGGLKKDLQLDVAQAGACEKIFTPAQEPAVQDNRNLGWVDCYQDILFTAPGGTSKRYDRTEPVRKAAFTALENISTAPVALLSGVLFDWRLPTSPSQQQYARGIFRTYGYQPSAGEEVPAPLWSADIAAQMNSLTFRRLRTLYSASPASPRVPIWIINATAASGNVLLDVDSAPYDLSEAVFEATPFGYGAGRFGYVRGYLDDLGVGVADTVLASAAFFDTAQRQYNRFAVNSVLTLTNSRWGIDIANYRVGDATRRWHSLLPWPFYYLNDLPSSNSGPTIHLSDGGQSGDNLGMVSLIRRGMDKLIVVAGEQDFTATGERDGYSDLASLCAVNRYLRQQSPKRHIVFFGHPSEPNEEMFDLTAQCDADKVRLKTAILSAEAKQPVPGAVNPLRWRNAVWRGRIVPLDDTQAAASEKCVQPACAEVFYLMSGLDRARWMAKAAYLIDDKKYAEVQNCIGYKAFDPDGFEYSCPVLQYLFEQIRDPVWRWPQTTTVGTTYNSSVNLARAYRYLGVLGARSLRESRLFAKE